MARSSTQERNLVIRCLCRQLATIFRRIAKDRFRITQSFRGGADAVRGSPGPRDCRKPGAIAQSLLELVDSEFFLETFDLAALLLDLAFLSFKLLLRLLLTDFPVLQFVSHQHARPRA